MGILQASRRVSAEALRFGASSSGDKSPIGQQAGSDPYDFAAGALQCLLTVLVFVMVSVASGAAGYIASLYTTSLIAACGCYGFAVLCSGGVGWGVVGTAVIPAGLAIICLCCSDETWHAHGVPLRLVAVSLFTCSWWCVGHHRASPSAAAPVTFLPLHSFILAAASYMFVAVVPLGMAWKLRSDLALELCRLLAPGLRIGASAGVFDVTMLAVLLLLTLMIGNKRAVPRMLVFGVIAVGAIAFVTFRFFDSLASDAWYLNIGPSEFDRDTPIAGPVPYFTVYEIPLLLTLLYPLVLSVLVPKPLSVCSRVFDRRVVLLCCCVAILLCIASYTLPGDSDVNGVEIAVDCRWDLSVPEHGEDYEYGTASTGMYGMFLSDLERRGATVTMIESGNTKSVDVGPVKEEADTPGRFRGRIGYRSLSDVDVLIVMVRTDRFDESELDAIRQFLAAGGGVLVVGDHTNLEGCQEPFNQLARPLGMELRFDSAYSHTRWWYNNLCASPTVSFHSYSFLDYGTGTGASVSLADGALPLLTGIRAFSDMGNVLKSSTKDAFLGDYHYQHGEQLGDVSLIAAARHGRGVMVGVGDSSLFQNLSYSRSGRFARQLVSLCSPQGQWAPVNVPCIAFLLIAWAGLALALIRRFAALLTVSATVILISSRLALFNSDVRGDTAIGVDAVILDQQSADINREPFMDHSYQALPLNLRRAGYYSEFRYTVSDALRERPKLLFVLAPERKWSRRSLQHLDEYMNEGGVVVVTAGWDSRRSANQLVTQYGFRITDTPLGGDVYKDQGPLVSFEDSWRLESTNPDTLYLARRLEMHVMLYCPVGSGGLLLIGDSQFFADRNLEMEKEVQIRNVRFAAELFEMLPDQQRMRGAFDAGGEGTSPESRMGRRLFESERDGNGETPDGP